MREIKFRAWDKRKNTWIHKDLFFISNAGFYEDYRELEDGISLFDYEYDLMQYTGLKDKNGKEIYEGDVVKVTFPGYYSNDWMDVVRDCEVKFDPEKASYYPFDVCKRGYPVTLIGNIYENPEMLRE